MQWSDELASKAQEWANKCVFQHSGGALGPFGENIAAGQTSMTQAVTDWTTNEAGQYDPSNPQASHFTQVVWKATTTVGCAVQDCNLSIFNGNKAQFWVCEYSPQGNVFPASNFATNVGSFQG